MKALPYTHEDLTRDMDSSCDHGASAIDAERVRALIDEHAVMMRMLASAEARALIAEATIEELRADLREAP